MKTIIKAKKNLYNHGLCFTKGKEYPVNGNIKTEAGLFESVAINDQGQKHIIGSWWRNFEIVGKSK